MKKARKKYGQDLIKIIQFYKSRLFGFASKNFYAEFLAALEVTKNSVKYFGYIPAMTKIKTTQFELPTYLKASTFIEYFKVEKNILRNLNPSLKNPIFRDDYYIPKGMIIILPEKDEIVYQSIFANIPSKKKFKNQKKPKWYRVHRGDNLLGISYRFNVRLKDLMAINNLYNPNKIYIGQKLRIPVEGQYNIRPYKSTDEVNLNDTDRTFSSAQKELAIIKDNDFFWIVTEPGETLGHYAHWLDVKTQSLRNLNGLRFRESIKICNKVKLPLMDDLENFVQKRKEFHIAMETNYFSAHKIIKMRIHTIDPGQNIWVICRNIYKIPIWLVKRFNENINLSLLNGGDQLLIPIVEKI